jgi:hypothetical protein
MSDKTNTISFTRSLDQIKAKIAAKDAERQAVRDLWLAHLAKVRQRIADLAVRVPDCSLQAQAFAEESKLLLNERDCALNFLEKQAISNRRCREAEAVEIAAEEALLATNDSTVV